MLGLFKKDKNNLLILKTPIKGKVIDIEDVPDAVFSQKMVGDGIAIEPIEGKVVSPVDGEILHIMDTKHAIGLKSINGVEILIHIGVDTVEMNGEGFEIHVSEGDKVKAGQLLIAFDLEKVNKKAKSSITPIVITNTDEIKSIEKSNGQDEEWIMKITV